MSCLSNLKTGYYYDIIIKHDILDQCPLIPQTFGNVKNDCKKCTLAQADDLLDNLSVEDMVKQRILWWDVAVDSLFRASHAVADMLLSVKDFVNEFQCSLWHHHFLSEDCWLMRKCDEAPGHLHVVFYKHCVHKWNTELNDTFDRMCWHVRYNGGSVQVYEVRDVRGYCNALNVDEGSYLGTSCSNMLQYYVDRQMLTKEDRDSECRIVMT